jgi:D-tyrosyl-tRNA(Tyr) deacylase
MKAIVQRVKQARVEIDGKVSGEICNGILVLLGIIDGDREKIEWMSRKLINLRIFPDEEGKMNRSVSDVGGGILIVSNFTLYGDVQKGTRPSFGRAAHPDISEPIYDEMIKYMRENFDVSIETGKFGAMMDVSLVNDGPVTIIIEK